MDRRRPSLARLIVPLVVASLLASLGAPPRPVAARAAQPDPVPATSADAPDLGGQLFSTGSRVEVQVQPASAGFTSELWLFEPGPAKRLATNRDIGLVVDVGTFPAGVELLFGIKVLKLYQTLEEFLKTLS